MAISAIVVTGLLAVGLQGQIQLTWSHTTPPGQGCLSYMQPAAFKVYWGTTAGFTPGPGNLLATVPISTYSETGLGAGVHHYYKVAAVDPNGFEGIAVAADATTLPAVAPAADLAAAVADYTALIAHEESERESADGAIATSLTTVSAVATDAQTKANLGTASGLLGFQVTAAPSGFTAAFQLLAKIAMAATLRVAGIAVDVTAALARLRLIGDSIVIQDSSGNIFPLFSNGQIAVGRLAAGIINATSLFLNGVQVVNTESIVTGAITSMVVTDPSNYAADTTVNPTDAGAIQFMKFIVTNNASVLCRFTALQDVPASDSANFGTYVISITRDNVVTVVSKSIVYDDNFTSTVILEGADTPGNGEHTYRIGLLITPNGGRAKWNLKGMQLVLQQFKR